MANRVHELAAHIRDEYDGDAGRVWTDASDSVALRANLSALPGIRRDEDQGARRPCWPSGSASRRPRLVPPHPTLGDVDSPQALLDYQSAKRAHKAEWLQMTAGA